MRAKDMDYIKLIESKDMRPNRQSFWIQLLGETYKHFKRNNISLVFETIESRGRYAKALSGIPGVKWTYAINSRENTAWVELEILGRGFKDKYDTIERNREEIDTFFTKMTGERLDWDKENHYYGTKRNVCRITSDSNYPFNDYEGNLQAITDDLVRRMIALIKVLNTTLNELRNYNS